MDPDERFPIQTIREPGYELLIFWGTGVYDPADVNFDIEIRTPGARYSGTVFTLRNIATLLRRWRVSGEQPNSYFRCFDAIVVDAPITEGAIRRAVAEAVATGDLEAWPRLEDLDDLDEVDETPGS
jgi:hypothetical protein